MGFKSDVYVHIIIIQVIWLMRFLFESYIYESLVPIKLPSFYIMNDLSFFTIKR